MSYEIDVTAQPRREIATVAWDTTWEQFPRQWPGCLDEVYACLRQAGARGGCNVMLYRDLAGSAWKSGSKSPRSSRRRGGSGSRRCRPARPP